MNGVLRMREELLRTPSKVVTAEVRVRHKDGSWRWIDCTITNLMHEESVGAMVMNFVQSLLNTVPLTFSTSRLYSPDSWMALAIVVAVAAVGLWMARGGETMLTTQQRQSGNR